MRPRSSLSLTKIERLPDAALPAVREAFDSVLACRTLQKDMLAALNAKLAALGLEAISRSGFNVWSQRVRSGEIRRPGPLQPATSPQVETRALPARLASAAELRLLADECLKLADLREALDGD
jgi:hypothetical protein